MVLLSACLATAQQCETREWPGTKEAAALRRPVMFRNAPTSSLASSTTIPGVLAKVGAARAKRSNTSLFVHTDASRTLFGAVDSDGSTVVEGDALELWAPFLESCGSFQTMSVETRLFDVDAYGVDARSLLWVATPGATTAAHYDREHNFFTQLVGSKRFELWEPARHVELAIYPFYHSRDRQSQIEPADPDVVCDLEPGVVLYCPPFWTHRVESKTLSLAFNAWSPSSENAVALTLNDLGLPPLDTAPAAATFVADVFVVTLGRPDHRSAAHDLVTSRYLRLAETHFPACVDIDPARCPDLLADDDDDDDMDGEWRAAADVVLEGLADKFASLATQDGNQAHAVAEIVAFDYVERVLTFVLGVHRVCLFLRCFELLT